MEPKLTRVAENRWEGHYHNVKDVEATSSSSSIEFFAPQEMDPASRRVQEEARAIRDNSKRLEFTQVKRLIPQEHEGTWATDFVISELPFNKGDRIWALF